MQLKLEEFKRAVSCITEFQASPVDTRIRVKNAAPNDWKLACLFKFYYSLTIANKFTPKIA